MSSKRKVFYIDLGKLSEAQSKEYIKKIKKDIKERKIK